MTKVSCIFSENLYGNLPQLQIIFVIFLLLEMEKKIFQIKGKEIILCKGHKGNVSDC